jgi:flavin-dependent dehydrogenase
MKMPRTNFDAIVVGARAAGAPTAMLLARAGARVLLVDRASFPSDTISGHAIKPPGVAYLKRWGLLDAVLATGCPPIHKLAVSVGDRALPAPPTDTLPFIAPRRTILDLTLIQAAAAAGADVHERTSVTGLIGDGDQVLGIEARGSDGGILRALAPIVIGADGKQSFIAHQVGAAYHEYQSPVSIAYYSYWSGSPASGLTLAFQPGRAAGLFPTHHGQVLAFVQARWSERHAFRDDAIGNYLNGLREFPAISDALAGATYEGPLRGMLDLPGFFRQSYGPGWALAGDAAHHKDPIIARGITDAFRDAELLSRAVSAGLGGETDLTPALEDYQEQRETASRHVNTLNHRLAELPDDLDEIQNRLIEVLTAEGAVDTQMSGAEHSSE